MVFDDTIVLELKKCLVLYRQNVVLNTMVYPKPWYFLEFSKLYP
jgi:hypothetical protein